MTVLSTDVRSIQVEASYSVGVSSEEWIGAGQETHWMKIHCTDEVLRVW